MKSPALALALFSLRHGPAWLRRRIALQARSHADATAVLRLAVEDRDRDVRLAAVAVIAAAASPKDAHLLFPLVDDRDEWVRGAVAHALGQHPSIRAGSHLVLLLRDRYPEVRENAALALARIPTLLHSPALEGALADANDRVRAAAARSLGEVGRPQAANALYSMATRDRVPANRLEATRAVDHINERAAPAEQKRKRAHDRLVDLLLDTNRPWPERVRAKACLIRVRDPSVLPRLRSALTESNDVQLHAHVLDILVTLPSSPELHNALIQLMHHPSTTVRRRAIGGVGELGDESAIFYLNNVILEGEKGASLLDGQDAALARDAVRRIRERGL